MVEGMHLNGMGKASKLGPLVIEPNITAGDRGCGVVEYYSNDSVE